jgi:RHS repeat-associated protein
MDDRPFDQGDVEYLVPGMIVLAEEDFARALSSAMRDNKEGGEGRWAPLDSTAVAEGAIIAGRANHPGTSGLFARVERQTAGQVTFEGRLFGVVPDDAFDGAGRFVAAQRFRVVGVELQGRASWVGRDTRFSGSNAAVTGDQCCGPATTCAPAPGGGGGDDPPVLMPSARVGVSPYLNAPYMARADQRPDAGMVRYTVYGAGAIDRAANTGTGFPGDPSLGGGGLPAPLDLGLPGLDLGDDLVCLDRIDPGCAHVTPICGPDDVGFATTDDDAADIPVGSSTCGGATRPVRGLNVPEACTYAYFGGDTTDPACMGTYGGPQNRFGFVLGGLPGATRDAANSLFCRVAQWIPGSGSPCETQTPRYQQMRTAELQLELGGVLPGQTKERCTTGKRGIEVCVTCTSDSCSESVVVPKVDPTIAGGAPADTNDNTEQIDIVDTIWTRDAFTGEVKATTTTMTVTLVLPSSTAPTGDPPKEAQPAATTPPGPPDPAKTAPAAAPAPPTIDVPDRPNPTHANTDTTTHGSNEKKNFTQPKRTPPAKKGDPVELGDGSLVLEAVDLEFPGPVRPLLFSRTYRSASRDRSALGSNWRHNWDVHLQVYDELTIPAWLAPWCAGLPGSPTALAVHWGDGASDLFLLDIESQLFLPQAGTSATVGRTQSGWAMRYPDGRVLGFDEAGCLISDSDRFGNAFVIEWERTPLGQLFAYFCSPGQLAARNETLAARRNCLLAFLVGAGPRPDSDRRWWEITAADFPLTGHAAAELEYARDYLLHLAGYPYPAESIDGGAAHRVQRVSDPLGRTLEFEYEVAAGYAMNPGKRAFANSPSAGLLSRVTGPVGTAVAFAYGQPTNYPGELNEVFLTGVVRDDTVPPGTPGLVAAPTRETLYEYQWPGGTIASYDGFADLYERRYAAYFATFVGCRFDGVYACGDLREIASEWAPGDPRFLAHLAANGYVSDVADNIVTVTHAGEIELETRYPADPDHLAFDRAVAQRYGAANAVQDPTRVAADAPGDAWQTSMPKATLEYCVAGPTATGDRTDPFLPAAIRDRYPLEPAPAPVEVEPPARSTPGGCDYARMEELRHLLPAARDALAYFDRPDVGALPFGSDLSSRVAGAGLRMPAHRPVMASKAAARLWRTPLAPEQLAGAQLWDPTHNDLLSTQVPNPAEPSSPLIERIVGRRVEVAKNNNRICAWVHRIDRDGDGMYIGLNYRGQALVEAREEGAGSFVFVDRFYNADGNLIEERPPTRSASPWQPGQGRTLHRYDEIDPTANRGWNAWLPVFWARRYNVRWVEVEPVGDVLDDDEQGSFIVGSGRFTEYRYEPLFNQVSAVISGSIAPGARLGPQTQPRVITVHSLRATIFDYQELSASVAPSDPTSIDPLLDSLRPWGFHWLRSDPEAFAFQLPNALVGHDINGDGAVGNRFASGPSNRAVGLPVLSVEGKPGGGVRTWFYRWSPHGMPTRIDGPDGRATMFEYYPKVDGDPSASLGGSSAPAATDVNAGWSGYLGQTTTRVIGERTPLIAGQAPVKALPGPYGNLGIDPATTVAALPAALAALGLPQEQVQDLLAAVGQGASAAATWQAVSYNAAGQPDKVFLPTGVLAAVTDTDGRVTRVLDPRSTVTDLSYDLQGRRSRLTTTDSAGVVLAESLRVYDSDDSVTMTVDAMVAGAATDPPPPTDAIVWRMAYTPEGQLREVEDPERLLIHHQYDAFKRVVLTSETPGGPGETRTTAYRYDVAGKLLRVVQGGTRARGPRAVQSFTYDGLNRLTALRDERGTVWQQAWSSRDLLTRQRCSAEPYGQQPAVPPARELSYTFDDFGDIAEQRQNGVVVADLKRSPGGALASSTGAGIGMTFRAEDGLGRMAWQRRPDNTEVVVTRREQPHRTITTVIRRDGAGSPRAVSAIVDLDELGSRTSDTRVGGSQRAITSFRLDGLGRVRGIDGPNGERDDVSRNLMGWINRATTYVGGTGHDTLTTFDRRGLVTSILDPAGQQARFAFDRFGSLTSAALNAVPAVNVLYEYDRLGRVSRTRDGAFDVLHEFDARNDAVLDRTSSGVDLTRRAFDDLGRLVRIDHTNPGLSWLSEQDRTVTTRFIYDRLDRVRREETELFGRPALLERQWTPTAAGWRGVSQARSSSWSATWESGFDLAGRFASRGPVGAPGSHTVFHWLGDLYAGRSQPQLGWQSRLEELVEEDEFLLPQRTTYRAIELDPLGNPQSALDGSRYAPTGWDISRCSLPLLEVLTIRDRVGRVAVESWRHGHPRVLAGALQAPAAAVLRVATYTAGGRLSTWREVDALVSTLAGLQSYVDNSVVLAAISPVGSQWTYDRTAETEDTTAIADGAGNDRLALIAARTAAHQLTRVDVGGSGFVFGHDAGGRVTTDGATTYTWHQDGTLATASRGAAFIEGYAYDGLGRMVGIYARNAPALPPAFRLVYDEDDPIVAFDDAKVAWQAAWGPLTNQLIEWDGGGGPLIPLLDGRSSPLGMWDPASAAVPETAAYTPEGRVRVSTGLGTVVCDEVGGSLVCRPVTGLPFGFTGAFRSAETGLVRMGARWYDPKFGQFLSMDPLWFVDGTNRYEYAGGDPINRFDPSGLSTRSTASRLPKVPAGKPVLPGGTRRPTVAPLLPALALPTIPALPPPAPAAPPKLPSSMSDAERDILRRKRDLAGRQSPRERAELDMEQRRRGWDEQTKDLVAKEVFDKAPVHEQLIFEGGGVVGMNDITVAATGEDWRAREVSTPERILSAISGALKIADVATGSVAAAGALRRTGKAVMIEIAPGMFRPGIRMPKAFPWQPMNKPGRILRDSRKYWRWMEEHYPGLFSEKNRAFIKKGWAPEVDAEWTKVFPEHELLTGDILEHHHWDRGADTIGLPEFLHDLWNEELHW